MSESMLPPDRVLILSCIDARPADSLPDFTAWLGCNGG